jgi:hypothetical protein
MEQHVFGIFNYYRGHHRKGVAIYNAHLSSYTTKTLVSLNKKYIFEHYREIQTRKYLLIDIIFVMKKNF